MDYNIRVELKIHDEWVDKSEYVQLPLSIKTTMDESLDIGELVLNFTNDSREYEAFTPVLITITDNSVYI